MAQRLEQLKKCTVCGEPKYATEFYSRKNGRRSSECKSCSNKRNKESRVKNHYNYQAYYAKPKAKFSVYNKSARQRGHEFGLTFDEFVAFSGKQCHYCGEILDTIRIDRYENDKGYTTENCVPCCQMCNMAKHYHSPEKFKEWVKRVHNHWAGK